MSAQNRSQLTPIFLSFYFPEIRRLAKKQFPVLLEDDFRDMENRVGDEECAENIDGIMHMGEQDDNIE